MLTNEEKDDLNASIDNEGFDYCFRHYSSFKEIEDKKFHELLKAYNKAADDLEKYMDLPDY